MNNNYEHYEAHQREAETAERERDYEEQERHQGCEE